MRNIIQVGYMVNDNYIYKFIELLYFFKFLLYIIYYVFIFKYYLKCSNYSLVIFSLWIIN